MLPDELLVMIFSCLNIDSIDSARKVCTAWQDLIRTSLSLWKSLVIQFCLKDESKSEFLKLPIYRNLKSAFELECFLRKLVKLDDNLLNNKFAVRTLNCLEAEVKGIRVIKSEDWEQVHNYKGVYDMILNGNTLVASVYDTIQVWDMTSYSARNILSSNLLDDPPHSVTTCFTLLGDRLVCGTQSGQLNLYDLTCGKLVDTAHRNSNFVSDVCPAGADLLASLDWWGEVTVWQLTTAGLRDITGEGEYTVPRLLAGRENERLLAVAAQFLVTTYKSHLICYSQGQFFRAYPAPSDVFCIAIQGDILAFGCKGGSDSAAAGLMLLRPDRPPQLLYLRTPDNDPVISLAFSRRGLVLGDTNGELHTVSIAGAQFPAVGERTVQLGAEGGEAGVELIATSRSHEYRAFIWACQTDAYRVFSGDELGKILVHDYLMYDSDIAIEQA